MVGAGLFLIGSPSNERARRLDAQRVEALRHISESVNLYFSRHGRLPTNLEELSREGGVVGLTEPSARPYEYRINADEAYELCGTFQRDSAEREPTFGDDFWSHAPGRQCFRFETKPSQ